MKAQPLSERVRFLWTDLQKAMAEPLTLESATMLMGINVELGRMHQETDRYIRANRGEIAKLQQMAVIDETALWAEIEELNWADGFNYKAISKRLAKDPDKRKRLRDFAARAVSILAAAGAEVDFGSDDTRSDILYHIVGLGREEFMKTLLIPEKALPARNRAKYGSREGYQESFAYCFQA